MPASEAQIRANQANAAWSTGPKTTEGKERSRANSYKHGLTGTGSVLPEAEAAEVERRVVAFHAELAPSGEVGSTLVRRAATLSVRMERCAGREQAVLSERVREAMADFSPPEGVDEAEAAHLRQEAGRRALFDPSKEATLARKYEAAAERGFFRALKELRQVERVAKPQAPAQTVGPVLKELASFLTDDAAKPKHTPSIAKAAAPTPIKPAVRADLFDFAPGVGPVDVPFTIGRHR